MGYHRPRCRRNCACSRVAGSRTSPRSGVHSYADSYYVGKSSSILELDNYRLQLARKLLTSN